MDPAMTPWQRYKATMQIEESAGDVYWADEGVESEAEREFWDAHLGMKLVVLRGLVIQHKAAPYRIDFALPAWQIGIEIDGYEFHSDRRTFALDRERERDLDMAGWRLIRFAAAEVFRNPFECVTDAARLVAVFRRGATR